MYEISAFNMNFCEISTRIGVLCIVHERILGMILGNFSNKYRGTLYNQRVK